MAAAETNGTGGLAKVCPTAVSETRRFLLDLAVAVVRAGLWPTIRSKQLDRKSVALDGIRRLGSSDDDYGKCDKSRPSPNDLAYVASNKTVRNKTLSHLCPVKKAPE